jgi:hypothetical protein
MKKLLHGEMQVYVILARVNNRSNQKDKLSSALTNDGRLWSINYYGAGLGFWSETQQRGARIGWSF